AADTRLHDAEFDPSHGVELLRLRRLDQVEGAFGTPETPLAVGHDRQVGVVARAEPARGPQLGEGLGPLPGVVGGDPCRLPHDPDPRREAPCGLRVIEGQPGVFLGQPPGHHEVAGDLGGQFLRQRPQFGARLRVACAAGAVVRQRRVGVRRCGAFAAGRADPAVVTVAARPGGAPSAVVRPLGVSSAFEGPVAVAGTSLTPSFEAAAAWTAFVPPAAALAVREPPLALAAAGLASARPLLTAGTGVTGSGEAPLPAFSALPAASTPSRGSRAAFPALVAGAAGTPVPVVARTPLTGLGPPIVSAFERTAGLAGVTPAARVPLVALPAAGTAAWRSFARTTAPAVPGASRAATGAALATGGRLAPPVLAPPLAALVAAAVLFRAHHVRHCS